VAGIFMQNWLDGPLTPAKAKGALGGDIDGMLAEYVVLKQTGLVRGAGAPELSGSGHAALRRRHGVECAGRRDLKPGATVLIQGTGGVSIFALHWRGCGARVLGISSSFEKLERGACAGPGRRLELPGLPRLGTLGAGQTGGEGVDLVVEVGGLATLPRSLRAVRVGGVIAQVGVLSGSAEADALPIVSRCCTKWRAFRGFMLDRARTLRI
jgi:NADPH:quinone reductase-like Zn-dependent oxidoreductase